MKKWISLFAILALLTAEMPLAFAYDSRQEMRDAYQALGQFSGGTPYAQAPKIDAPYAPGELEPDALLDALDYLNFLRGLSGLDPVEMSRIYNYQCQHGAVLLAALDYVDHDVPQPEDMDSNFYDSAHLATTSSNLAKFNWMRPGILREGIAYFVRDDGEANLPVMGHRRWLLNPSMSATGFGLANSESGMSYVVMYAHDLGKPDVQWDYVAWPSEGYFPVELMHTNLAWSISLNPDRYDVQHSQIAVTLTAEELGLSFSFDCSSETGSGFCALSTENYGSGPCLIFRPDFAGQDFTDYQQNQTWGVCVDGLRTWDGQSVQLTYAVQMASLYPQEVVNLELSQIEAQLHPGERLQLTAAVIPSYADDLSVTWRSTDASVASVDASGTVTALAPGQCEIVAESANGSYDRCAVTILES